ncbi:MAG: PTS transporter subunit EIIC [[Clostridium] innocuum]
MKSIGRVCIFPAIFNINEPIVFGAPVVWNPILMIPLCLNSIIIPSLMYLVMRIGLVPIPVPMQMWYLPNIVQGYLTNSMSGYSGNCIVCCIWLIWMPFFRVFEKQQYKEDLENRKERRSYEIRKCAGGNAESSACRRCPLKNSRGIKVFKNL